MNQIIVAHRDFAEAVEHMSPEHEWSVEGDFGFLGSYATQNEAWAAALADATLAKAEVVLNA